MRYRYADRLTLKLAFGLTLLVVVVMSTGLYIISKHYYNNQIDVRRKSADLQNKLIQATLEHQMLKKDRTLIEKIVAEIAMRDEVQRMFILDHDGKVQYSSDPAILGTSFPQDSPSCQVCHRYTPGRREISTIIEREQGDILRSVQPIRNQPACYECHSPSVEVNGMLILDTSIASLKEELGRDVRAMALAGAIIMVGMLAGIGLILRKLVLRRLSALAAAARSLASGKLQHRVEIEGNDQITVLGTEFNNMADSLTRLLGEVRREQARLENIMNGVGDSLFVLDRDCRIVAANEAFIRRPDIAGEGVLGRSCCEVINKGASCAPEDHCLGVKCFSTGQPQRGTIISPTAEGERVWDVHTSPIFDEDGTLTQVVEVWRDITDRMREEMQLAEFERLTSLGMLASGFSHEMNTPLASMLLSVDRIREKIEVEEGLVGSDDNIKELREYAEIVRTEILRCTKITNQFLRFSRGQQFSVELVDINQVVEAVVPLVLPTARENGVSVAVGPSSPMPMTRANYGLMQQVLLNLLINAVQSCGEGDEVTVSCKANADVRIITEDSGAGIPQEEIRRIFEPFYSRRSAGTGLGLFLSLSMVRRFGGDISVDSEVGRGSRFEIVLPIPEENAP